MSLSLFSLASGEVRGRGFSLLVTARPLAGPPTPLHPYTLLQLTQSDRRLTWSVRSQDPFRGVESNLDPAFRMHSDAHGSTAAVKVE